MVQCSAEKYSALQFNTVHYRAVQCSTVQYSLVQCITGQYSLVQCITVQWRAMCEAVQCCILQCGAVHYFSKLSILLSYAAKSLRLF